MEVFLVPEMFHELIIICISQLSSVSKLKIPPILLHILSSVKPLSMRFGSAKDKTRDIRNNF